MEKKLLYIYKGKGNKIKNLTRNLSSRKEKEIILVMSIMCNLQFFKDMFVIMFNLIYNSLRLWYLYRFSQVEYRISCGPIRNYIH